MLRVALPAVWNTRWRVGRVEKIDFFNGYANGPMTHPQTGSSGSKSRELPGYDKSWKTSHLPLLRPEESQFLLDLMHAYYHQKKLQPPAAVNWQVVWEYIDRQGLGGALGALALDGLVDLPEHFEHTATHRYFSTQVQFAQAKRCCEQVQRVAADQQIPVVVLKGPALVTQAYADSGVRQFSDIDLFTCSLADVEKICRQLGLFEVKSTDKHTVLQRLGESEGRGYMLDNWELEFRYPQYPPGEPMFELLNEHRDTLIGVPRTLDDMLRPNLELHLVFLLQHMSVHHLLSRFFWFLDIALFMKSFPSLDLEKVENSLAEYGQLNMAAVVTRFCRQHIDNRLPVFAPRKKGWNIPAMQSFAMPENISSGKYGIYHRSLRGKIQAYLTGMLSFYLVSDGGFWRILINGSHWTCRRVAYALKLGRAALLFEIASFPFIAAALVPLAMVCTLYWKMCRR